MKRLVCFFVGHRWRRYWTPLWTWMGAKCERCGSFKQGQDAFNGARS